MDGLNAAIEVFGTRTALAKACGVSSMAIRQWELRGVPLEQVPVIVSVTGGAVSAHQLRPDYFAADGGLVLPAESA